MSVKVDSRLRILAFWMRHPIGDINYIIFLIIKLPSTATPSVWMEEESYGSCSVSIDDTSGPSSDNNGGRFVVKCLWAWCLWSVVWESEIESNEEYPQIISACLHVASLILLDRIRNSNHTYVTYTLGHSAYEWYLLGRHETQKISKK